MTVLEPTLAQRWTRWRRPLATVALLIIAALVFALAQSQYSRGYLDPNGVDTGGSRALVRILQAQGVDVTPATKIGEVTEITSAGDTVLVTNPDLLVSEQVSKLRSTGADLVLVAPMASVEDFASAVTHNGYERPRVVDPDCDLMAAELAGSARMGGSTYDAPDSATSCYPSGGAASLVVATSGDATVTILGSADPLTNRYLDEDGNGALALNLLGASGDLTWYQPTLEPGMGGDASFSDVVPGWVAPVAWQLVVAAALAALWRARRFGPLVTEPLPVVVPAAEVTEGRATLYRRGRARGHAAQSLREATTSRLRTRLGLPHSATAEDVAALAASQTDISEHDLVTLLAGEAPLDDATLVELGNDLTDLETRL
jgi:hypothetical protein